MSGLPWLDPYNDEEPFPPPEFALREPDGLLAVGGSLSPKRLLRAYRAGIFPWYSPGQPILWWSPNPRTVLFPHRLKVSRSLGKTLKKQSFAITMDKAFVTVMERCAEPRRNQEGTWITREMIVAYSRLYRMGYAHSVEIWNSERLAGGLYGVAIGRVFFGESMFSRMNDASKIALVALCRQLERWEFGLIDCQMHTAHLISLGAEDIPRHVFLELLARYCQQPAKQDQWRFEAAESLR